MLIKSSTLVPYEKKKVDAWGQATTFEQQLDILRMLAL